MSMYGVRYNEMARYNEMGMGVRIYMNYIYHIIWYIYHIYSYTHTHFIVSYTYSDTIHTHFIISYMIWWDGYKGCQNIQYIFLHPYPFHCIIYNDMIRWVHRVSEYTMIWWDGYIGCQNIHIPTPCTNRLRRESRKQGSWVYVTACVAVCCSACCSACCSVLQCAAEYGAPAEQRQTREMSSWDQNAWQS